VSCPARSQRLLLISAVSCLLPWCVRLLQLCQPHSCSSQGPNSNESNLLSRYRSLALCLTRGLFFPPRRQDGGLMTCGILPLLFLLFNILCVRVRHNVVLRVSPSCFYATQVPRHPGPQYTAHDITKGHPSLVGTPPGHAHSPALSQVSLPTASPYRYPKGWETDIGVSSSTCPPSLHLHVRSVRLSASSFFYLLHF